MNNVICNQQKKIDLFDLQRNAFENPEEVCKRHVNEVKNGLRKKIEFQFGLVKIPDSVFFPNTLLKEVIIPKSVIFFGYHAFQECNALEKVVIPSSVLIIGTQAFYQCTSLKNVVLPHSIVAIGYSAFF